MNQLIISFYKTIILFFFRPESYLVNSLRWILNCFNEHIFTIEWQLKRSRDSYLSWIRIHEQTRDEIVLNYPFRPLVSFLVPKIENNAQIKELIRSLQAQTYPNWELILESNDAQTIDLAVLDNRIKFVEAGNGDYISLATQANGDFVICSRASDLFSGRFLAQCVEKAYETSDVNNVQIIYADHDRIGPSGKSSEPFFKPDAYSPELLYSTNYLSRALLRRDLMLSVKKHLLTGVEPDVQEWELILNCASPSPKMIHVANVLIHQRPTTNKNSQVQTRLMLNHYLKQVSLDQPKAAQTIDGWRVSWHNKQPLVSIVIPSKNNYLAFKQCIDSIFKLTNYKNYELIIIDNNSADENLLIYYQNLITKDKIRIVEYNEPFNYSRAINMGGAAGKGDLLLFLNNDMRVLNEDWLDELVRWALIPEIGIVGGKLLYPNGSIQHAGVVLGLEGFVDHLYMNAPQDYHGLIGSVNWYRNVSAVTGACQMMRRTVFDELGGYDENYHLIYSDIDICLKATQKNYRILYTPFAKLIHYHGMSRNRKDPMEDLALGFKDLISKFDGNDPFFSPNLTYTYIPQCQIKPESGDDRLARMREKQAIFERWANK